MSLSDLTILSVSLLIIVMTPIGVIFLTLKLIITAQKTALNGMQNRVASLTDGKIYFPESINEIDLSLMFTLIDISPFIFFLKRRSLTQNIKNSLPAPYFI